jgi:hypothetical protein
MPIANLDRALRLLGGVLLLAGCGSAAVEPTTLPSRRATVVSISPVEELFNCDLHDHCGSHPPILTQCDGHGHRVYVGRHPEDPVVITDPSCER